MVIIVGKWSPLESFIAVMEHLTSDWAEEASLVPFNLGKWFLVTHLFA